jgi:hypothetical protein
VSPVTYGVHFARCSILGNHEILPIYGSLAEVGRYIVVNVKNQGESQRTKDKTLTLFSLNFTPGTCVWQTVPINGDRKDPRKNEETPPWFSNPSGHPK